MKIVTIVGARPQFIKAAVVSREIREQHTEILVHTGQHYDHELSQAFFQDLEIPEPDYNLAVGSGTQGFQTGHGLLRLEPILMDEEPDLVLLYGDTNATLSGALAAAKLNIPIAHVEAGIRHYDRRAPEEINRLITDHLSTFLFCPTQTTVDTLQGEGITQGVYLVGDVLLDVMLVSKKVARNKSNILVDLEVEPGKFYLATVHRPINTDNQDRLMEIFLGLQMLDFPVVLPLHPRTVQRLEEYGKMQWVKSLDNVLVVHPLGYLDFLMLEQSAKAIITDSGSVQREAYFLEVPCVTLHTRRPWPETIQDGWNVLLDPQREAIVETVTEFKQPDYSGQAFGNGTASERITEIITNWYQSG